MSTTNALTRSPLHRRRSPGALCTFVLCAGMAVGAASPAMAGDLTAMVQIEAPRVISVELPTDYLAWDLCWGQFRREACQRLADQIVEQIDDPDALYVIELPQLSPRWTPVRVARQKFDFKGQKINHDLLKHARLTYENDIEQAVIGLIGLIREARPGVRLTVNNFTPVAPKGRRAASYLQLADHLDFIIAMEFDRGNNNVGLDRRVTKRLGKRQLDSLEDERLPILARNGQDWYAMGFDDESVQELMEPDPVAESAWGGDDDTADHEGDDTGVPGQDDAGADETPVNDEPWIIDTEAPEDDPGFEAGGGNEPEGEDGGDGGEPQAAPEDDDDQPQGVGGGGGGGGVDLPAQPATFTITLPTQQQMPYGSQWGTQNQDTLLVYPAQYEAHSNAVVAISLSYPSATPTENNPYVWNNEFRGVNPDRFLLMEEGFGVVSDLMQMVYDAGYREVWFWGLGGQHAMNSDLAEQALPWLLQDVWTQPMIDTWPDFVEEWKGKGMKLGVYIGSVCFPNTGTTTSPVHSWLTRDHFEYIGDTVKHAKDMGFDVVGLDAFVWILSMRDMPEWATNWQPVPGVGPRDKGIALDLITYLRNRPDLQGMEYFGESMLPYGKFLASLAALELMFPQAHPSPHFKNITTLEGPEVYDRVNPGRELIKMLSGNFQWPEWEYNALRQKCDEWNYRLCIDYRVLQQMGEIGTLQHP